MKSKAPREIATKRTIALWIGLSFLLSVDAHGQGDFSGVCSDENKHAKFIEASLTMVREGANRDAVLDELLCIASSNNRWAAAPALRALFHIAGDNNRIRDYLLRVINNERTTSLAAADALRLFVYVADEEGRNELLERVKRQWENRGSDCKWSATWEALIELGDVAFLGWLDKTAEALGEDDPLRAVLDRGRTMIRLQENASDLLAYLRSAREDIDRGWVVRQAIRHGASRDEIRNAVLEYLRRAGDERSLSLNMLLVRACDEYGIFNSEDVADMSTIRAIRQIRYSTDDEVPQWPQWATRVEDGRAEFYRIRQ